MIILEELDRHELDCTADRSDCPVALRTMDALLDAPKVWWCSLTETGWDAPIAACTLPRHDDCGWRLLVPVKGEA